MSDFSLAVIWKKRVTQIDGSVNDYQVRNAGKSLRLYRNGVFHTQYHPERIVTGDIWELLLVASLGIKDNAHVLVLGAGGGAVVNLLNYFVKPAHVDVVDIDATHLYLCQRFFLKNSQNITLIEADALTWLESQSPSSKKYDLIIEDLFGEEAGQPIKAFEFSSAWLALLCRQLSSNGRLVMNFESSQELLNSAPMRKRSSLEGQGFHHCLRLSSPRYQNNIGVFSRSTLESAELRAEICSRPLLKKQSQHYYLRKA